jgi:hypothetical protein
VVVVMVVVMRIGMGLVAQRAREGMLLIQGGLKICMCKLI